MSGWVDRWKMRHAKICWLVWVHQVGSCHHVNHRQGRGHSSSSSQLTETQIKTMHRRRVDALLIFFLISPSTTAPLPCSVGYLYSTTPTPRFGVACKMISGLDQVGGTPTIFTCDTVTRENDCRITSRVINIYRHPWQAMECFVSNTLLRNCEVSNTVKTPSSRHSCLRGISWSRYCDVTLIHCGVILTEFPQNVSILSTQKLFPVFSHRRQVDHHSLIIEWDSQRYHPSSYKIFLTTAWFQNPNFKTRI